MTGRYRIAICYRHLVQIAALLLVVGLSSAHSAEFSRRVVGVYNSAEGKTAMDNPLRRAVEAPLHYLGMHLDYHDLATGIPDSATMAGARGVIIWLESDRLPQPLAYWRWLESQARAGRRIVLLNTTGPRFDTDGVRVPLGRVNDALSRLGLSVGDNYSSMPLDIELVHKDAAMVEFERRLDYELTRFTEVRSTRPDSRTLLRLRLRSSGVEADAVVIGPWGGYASEGYLLYRDIATGRVQWRINPFAFFDRALGLVNAPRPDPTTLFGSRLLYSHIDGDGLRNRSLIDRQSASGEVVLHDILSRYDDLPFTVSVVTSDVDPAVLGSPAVVQLARRFFALANVEPASHSFSHPLVWNRAYTTVEGISEYAEVIEDAVLNGPALLPFDVPGYVYDPVAETVGSCRFIDEHLLPEGKRTRVLLWSGNCLPGPDELAALEAHGLLNMNGGDSRFDGDFASYYYVAPLYRQVEGFTQVHSSNSNENTYTNLWTGPFGGFQNVIQTFENTEAPRRVLPVNVYFHFYSGEQEAAMQALHRVYEWIQNRREDLLPIYASRYIEGVTGFIDTRIDSVGAHAWEVRNYGACRTVRFDNTELVPDLEHSQGVLGFRRHQAGIYVHLADSSHARVHMTTKPPSKPYLAWSTVLLDNVSIRDGRIGFTYTSLGPCIATWDNLPPQQPFAVSIDGRSTVVRSTAQGTLRLDLQAGTSVAVLVRGADPSSTN